MPRRALSAAALLVTTTASLAWMDRGLAQALPDSAVTAPPPTRPDEAAIKVLLDQANYWFARNRPEDAEQSLERLLAIAPDNADALALLTRIGAASGDRVRAQASLAKLRDLHPHDPRIAGLDHAVRVGRIDPDVLAEARSLAREGRNAEALSRYQGLFHGAPPPDELAVEYYMTLAGTEGGWSQARAGLAQAVADHPSNLQMQLAYARLLTFREQTRADGIQRLALLVRNPATAAAAETAWRQGLDWLPVDASSIPAYQAWLAVHPNDGLIIGKLEQARSPPRSAADEAAIQRSLGFTALNAGKLTEADNAFRSVLARSPQDPDALGGLGLVRLRQGNADEARNLLSRAIAADPAHKDRWEQALQGASVGAEYAAARAAMQRGQYDAAERQLRAIIARGGDITGAQLMLAGVLSRRGHLSDAEGQYRSVIARQPGNADALIGLAQVLDQSGRSAEAEALLDRVQGGGNRRVVGRIRADALRRQARAAADPMTRVALLQAASAADPADPWISLDLARVLRANGRASEARSVMADLAASAHPSLDALRAAAIFASEDDRPDDAVALINRLPDAARTPEMRDLLARAGLRNDVRIAVGLGGADPAAARSRLLTLAAQPDPDGSRGAALAQGFFQMKDPAGAREVVAAAQAATASPTQAQRIAYAGILLQAGDERGAQALIEPLEGATGLTTDQRRAVDRLRAGVAVRQADALNARHRQAEAHDVLAPALARDPTNPDLNLALARVYSSSDQPRRALAITDAVLARDPNDIDARRAAVDAAIAASDWTRAAALVRDGLDIAPDDPRSWIMSAAFNRASGNLRRAHDDLQRARSLRRQEIDSARTAVPQGESDRTQEAASRRNDASSAPRSDTSVMAVAPRDMDPTLQDIDGQLSQVQEDLAPQITIGPTYRSRSGTNGLDRLQEVTLPSTLLVRPLGSGVLSASATPTFLSSGTIPTDTQASFGTGVFPGSRTPSNQRAQGLGLSVAYQQGWMKADIGTSPIGFQEQNMLGGVELSPQLDDHVRLRVTGERRAVTDSVLSYAGTKDPTSGIAWGGVTRTRGHAQLEVSVHDVNLYAGGGYAVLNGTNVEQNHEYEFGAGGSVPVWRGTRDDVRVGLDLVYFAYDKNLRFFTLGQGGYFSPQSYFATLLPIHYTFRGNDLTWSAGGSIGYQTYNEHASLLFPNDPDRQAAVMALASSTPVLTGFAGDRASGLVGGAEGSVEYRVNGVVRLGGEVHYQHAGNWNETVARLYMRYIFN